MTSQVDRLASTLINKLNLITTPAIHEVMAKFPEVLSHQWNIAPSRIPGIGASITALIYISSWELAQIGGDIREIATRASLDNYMAEVTLFKDTVCGVKIEVTMAIDQMTTSEERQLLRDLGRVVIETNPANSYETVVCGV